MHKNKRLAARCVAVLVASAMSATAALAQTTVTAPKNSFKPAEDVQLGQQAAAEVRKQLPLLQDSEVQAYVERIGRRLVTAIPPELQHPEFRYTFQVVNASDINAFALPGGPMFVNRGMIAAAKDEGEVAGVMAHELSHVVLRHGTAQATKAQKYQFGELAGAIIGAVVGGTAGAVIAQGTQFGLGTAFLRFSREYEKQADIEGSHIMARAGYSPVAMAQMFKTIEQSDKARPPQWLSDHPDPGNRVAYITKEAQLVQVTPQPPTGQLQAVRAELQRLPPARTTEQIMKNAQNGQGRGEQGSVGTGGSGSLSPNVAPPSSTFRNYDEGNLFRVSVPSNWNEMPGNNSVTFAPAGGAGDTQGHSVFTHGIELGVTRNEGHDLQAATQELVQSLTQGNPNLKVEASPEQAAFAGRQGLQVRLRNVSDVTGAPETVLVTTAMMDDGNLIYSIGVAPQSEFARYERTLQRINQSVQLQK